MNKKTKPVEKDQEKQRLRDIFEVILGSKVPSSQVTTYVKENFGDNLTHAELICIGQILKAQNERDTKAAEYIRDTMGQKPGDKHEITGSRDNPFVVALDPLLEKWGK